jgi:hypothetical protein
MRGVALELDMRAPLRGLNAAEAADLDRRIEELTTAVA